MCPVQSVTHVAGLYPPDPAKGRCPLDPRQGQRPLEPVRWLW